MDAPIQLTMAVAPDHRNQFLFSDHYLNNLLLRDPRWDAALPEAEAFLAWLQDLYAGEQGQLADYNESQLENHWFRPLLSRLGHVFEGQATIPGLDAGVKRPDYVFFSDEGARQAAVGAQSSAGYSAEALAVGEVKRWDTPLGKKRMGRSNGHGGGPSFENQNPSWQIDYYLRATNLDWGILTNGRLWRLVHKDTSQRLSIYYEVDLVELLSRSDAGALRYFTLFFRQAAFRPDAQGRVFLDDALAASNAYAVALEEDLEENVYRALEWLMQGFLDLPANGLGVDDLRPAGLRPADLRAVYDNSLYLLYRLLFILYGESRGLLPMDNEQYREQYSLEAIKGDIVSERAPTAALTTIIWGRLKTLFHIINGDDAELNRSLGMPRYNGGLFNPQQHPFLDEKAVGDRALGQAIDLLSRRTTEAGRELVDYRSLGVRHLGSIYEGLLEYQPHIQTSEEAENPAGLTQVYLATDRGERKSTGSYYTPQYIVAYIVEQTLGPLVEEATERVRVRAGQARGRAARVEAEQSLVDEILNLKVLDPAMGSGHFLVEATEFLALALATDPYVETEAPAEEDMTHWKRRVVERCIYGVDKNPLAVELAKLSLWLATVAADKPLSFLDHHLKCGDSLIGARVDDLGEVPPVMLSKKVLRERKALYEAGVRQANLFETRLTEKLPVVMGRILEITEVESKDYDTVRAKEAADRAVQQLKAPFQAVADLWTSGYFGNEFINGEYDEALMNIGRPDALLALPAVQRARAIAEKRRFFHWELAFPEVFYDQNGQRLERAGFDAVVGNPPYIQLSMEQYVDPHLKSYLLAAHKTSMGRLNTFGFFLKLGMELVREAGYEGMIVPNTVLTMTYYTELREMILDTCRVRRILAFNNLPFEEAVVENVVLILQATSSEKERLDNLTSIDFLEPTLRWFTSHSIPQKTFAEWRESIFNPHLTNRLLAIRDQLQVKAIPLGNLVHINQAIALKHDRAKWLFDKCRGPDFKPLLDGRDINRYQIRFPGVYLKYDLRAIHSCKRQDIFLANEKIFFRRVSDRIIACYDDDQFYALNTLVVANLSEDAKPLSLKYLLALLNSRLHSWYFVVFLKSTKEVFSEIQAQQVEQLPIRRIEFTTPAGERERLVAEAKARAEESVRALAASGVVGSDAPLDRAMLAQAASPALSFVEARLAAEPEQADVVHDLLAHLAERMIEMNKQKQARVEDFWLDLEGATEDDTFEILRHKGKQERTLWRRSGACRPFVSEESRSTRRLDESLAWSEEAFKAFVKALAGKVSNLSDVVGVYRKHHPAYREMVARIAATDWLIDQIVYKLYDLIEEEIAIVEGKRE